MHRRVCVCVCVWDWMRTWMFMCRYWDFIQSVSWSVSQSVHLSVLQFCMSVCSRECVYVCVCVCVCGAIRRWKSQQYMNHPATSSRNTGRLMRLLTSLSALYRGRLHDVTGETAQHQTNKLPLCLYPSSPHLPLYISLNQINQSKSHSLVVPLTIYR